MSDLSMRRTGSLDVVLGAGCSMVCEILVPYPGVKPSSPALQNRFLITRPSGNSLGGLSWLLLLICSSFLSIICFQNFSFVTWLSAIIQYIFLFPQGDYIFFGEQGPTFRLPILPSHWLWHRAFPWEALKRYLLTKWVAASGARLYCLIDGYLPGV